MDSAQMLDLIVGARRAFSKGVVISHHHIASNLAFDDAMRAYVHPYFGELVIGPSGCFLHTGSLAEYEIPLKDLADEDALMTWVKITCALGG